MKRIKCDKCQREQFEAARCVCGASLLGAQQVGPEHEIAAMTFHLPKVAQDIVYEWFMSHYNNNEELRADHVALAKRLEFIDPNEEAE